MKKISGSKMDNQIEQTEEHSGKSSCPDYLSPDEEFKLLTDKLKGFHADEEVISTLEKAYEYAADKHKHQKRTSGEPYINHPLQVANILTSYSLDTASITAAILHDTVEDTDATLEEITDLFGEQTSVLVDGLTKIGKIKFRSKQEKLAENFRKMVLAMAKDLRVIIIKLCDRLHNMRTLGCLPEDKRIRIAQETIDIYAPLSNRLGIYGIKSELEDLCLKELKPEVYKEITTKVDSKKAERETYIDEVKSILDLELKKYGFKSYTVLGRPKHFFSIYKKMIDRKLFFEDIHDLFAFRIVVQSVKDCYEALGIVHAMWKPMPGRFKDYIAMPKANYYQSLHTTVIRPNGEPAEIQIRTEEMNKVSEFGVAAHWSYKENSNASKSGTDFQKFSWLKQIMEWQQEIKDSAEFLEAVKVDLFDQEIFVFTPKGDVFQLPLGATSLDFAFSIHTEVGLRTTGTKVNGRMAPLRTKLKNGDIVEVLTSPSQQPSDDWLNFVTTSKAKNKIRSYLRTEHREQSRVLGKDLLSQSLDAIGSSFDKFSKNSIEVNKFVKFGKESSLDDVFIALGYGKLDAKDLLGKLYPGPIASVEEQTKTILEGIENKAPSTKKRQSSDGILVSGMGNVLVSFAKCCNPLPGDDILGYISRGRGVTVHRDSCPRALDLDPVRRIDVSWADAEAKSTHLAYLRIETQDRQGILAEVTTAISMTGANILKANIQISNDFMGHLDFEISVKSLSQLNKVISKIETLEGVVTVTRRSDSMHN
jgi:GTP diphosphokinase / guanosine-3',5'-bis(diphosphate) 3'-diphosphatase